MLIEEQSGLTGLFFRDVVEAIFATSNRDEAEAVIEEFNRFSDEYNWHRGATGKNSKCTNTIWELFEEV